MIAFFTPVILTSASFAGSDSGLDSSSDSGLQSKSQSDSKSEWKSEWIDEKQPNLRTRHIPLSEKARDAAQLENTQSFPNEDWDADKQKLQQKRAPLEKTREPVPLQGGVTSSVLNFGQPGDANLQGLGAQARVMMLPENSPNPSYPTPKTVSPSLYKNWLQSTHPELKATEKNAIVEIKGQWDDSGHILHYFGWLFTKLNPNSVSKFDFSQTSVAIVDCAGDMNQGAIETLRAFVWNGGYLVSTDWSLDNFIVKAFPGAIEWNGGYSYPDLVDAICVEPNPDFIKGCVPVARWKLDDKCQTVKVIKPAFVHVLVRSRLLSRQDPDGFGILAASFQYGAGQVLHVVGHFDINSAGTFTNSLPDPAPRIGIGLRQAIIANFIVNGLAAGDSRVAKVAGSKDK